METLSLKIKEATKSAHQHLEKQVVKRLKAIRNENDYAGLLKYFYAYFHHLEQVISPYLSAEVLPDYATRRNSSYLKKDIEELGDCLHYGLPPTTVPDITSRLQALGALYVMEGSVMGGSIIVQMLEKAGVTKGISFFSGYGADTKRMWAAFTEVLNAEANTPARQQEAMQAARDTFSHFSGLFERVPSGSVITKP